MACSTSLKTCSREVKMALISDVFFAWGWKRLRKTSVESCVPASGGGTTTLVVVI